MDLRDHLLNMIIDSLEEMNVDTSIINSVEAYIEDDTIEIEFLRTLPKVDFTILRIEQMPCTINAYHSIMKYSSEKYLRKYINILYEIGGANASYVLEKNEYSRITEGDIRKWILAGVSEEVAISIYANSLAFYYEGINKENFNIIYEVLEKNPDIIIKAMKNVNENGAVILASIYCSYNNIKKNNIFDSLIKSIEWNFINSIGNLFDNNIPDDTLYEIKGCICSRKNIPKKIIDKTKKYKSNEYLFKFISRLSFINIDKSNILKKFILFLVEIDSKETLNNIYAFIDNDSYLLSNLDKYLGIPSKYFISWYAEKFASYGENNIVLENRFKEDRKSFEEAIKISEKHTSDILTLFLIECNSEHDDLLESKCISAFTRMLKEEDVTEKQINASIGFLTSNNEFEELDNIVYSIEFSKTIHWKIRRDLINVLKILCKKSGRMIQIYRRAVVLLSLYGSADCIIELVSEKDDTGIVYKTDNFRRIFDILDEFDVSMRVKLKLIDKMTSHYDYENRRAIALRPIIDEFIDKDKDLLSKEIKELSVEGRKLFLEIIFEEKTEENARILIGYFDDMSKVLKNKIIDLFSDSYEYFDLVSERLKARKQSEREMAIRIIGVWHTDKGFYLLNQLYKNEKSLRLKKIIDEINLSY